MANAVEQALLLPKDMIEWQSMRKHKVFLGLKRELTLVSLLSILFFFFRRLSRLPTELRK